MMLKIKKDRKYLSQVHRLALVFLEMWSSKKQSATKQQAQYLCYHTN